MENVKLEIRLYLSNVHTETQSATIQLECNNVQGHNDLYWPMMTHMEKWILDNVDDPVFSIPMFRIPMHPDIMVVDETDILADLDDLID